MMAALTNASLVSSNMLYQLGGIVQQNYTRQQAQQGYRTLKPKRDVTQVTCATAELLMEELIQFEIDLQELGVTGFAEAAFFQLRAVTQGQAKDVIEFALVREPMKTLHAAALALPSGEEWEGGYPGRGYQRTQAFRTLYQHAARELRKAVNLTDARMRQLANDKSGQARMRGESADDAI